MLQKSKGLGRKFVATFTGLLLITGMMGLVTWKAPTALGNWALPVYMFLVVFIILGYMKLNVDQKRFLAGAISKVKDLNDKL